MNWKRWLLVAIWVVMLVTAAVIIWQMQNENNTDGNQTVDSSAGVAGQSPTTPAPDIQPGNTTPDTAFKQQVLRYYEISNTENLGLQQQLLPSVATRRFLDSYRWNFRSDNPTVTTMVDPTRSNVSLEISETDKNVRYVATSAYVIKTDTTTSERYEELYPVDHTTWILEAGGTWKIYGPTVTQDAHSHS